MEQVEIFVQKLPQSEKLSVSVEKFMENKNKLDSVKLGVITALTPIYFLKTLFLPALIYAESF